MLGSGCVVMDEVEPDTTVAGPKSRPVKHRGARIIPSVELDQIHLPDPLAQEMCRLLARIEMLEKRLAQKDGIELESKARQMPYESFLNKECSLDIDGQETDSEKR
jgi:serine O-acetyltransferase